MPKKFRREKRIETNVCGRALRDLQVPNIPLKLHLGTNNGWPDRLFLVGHNRVKIIEFKDPDEGEVAPLQARMLQMLKDMGYDAEVHDNEEQALEAIESAKLEAARLSEEGGQVPARKRRRNRASRSGAG